MSFLRTSSAIILFLVAFNSAAQENIPVRLVSSVNDNWRFNPSGTEFAASSKTDAITWERVNIPHTWNALDPFDDDKTYRRGISWYRKELEIGPALNGHSIYLCFEGANQVSDVYVNGAFVGQHKGGYTAFNFNITAFVHPGKDNVIAVQVNNAQDNFIAPLSVGYALYGGIYRDVWLVGLQNLHFAMDDHGSSSVFVRTPDVSIKRASVAVRCSFTNETAVARSLVIEHSVFNSEQILVSTTKTDFTIGKSSKQSVSANLPDIESPNLWSPEHPNLYTVRSRLIENGKVLDEVNSPLGLRWFSFNARDGFHLNGQKYTLHGTNRHQDFKGKGSALTNEDHFRDLKMIKDMGCNFLRLAHYPQDPEVLRLADKMGLLIWEETPVVNNINPDPAFLINTQVNLREMIRQHYNHPSIIMWGSMNEVLLWSKESERIQVHKDTVYLNQVKNFAVKMDSTVRAEDPGRYSTMAMHMSEDYEKTGLAAIPQVSGWNIYNGWYSGKVEEFGQIFDKKHADHPNEILLVSEYGAESDKQVNSENPQRLDFTGEYQRYFHESYLEQLTDRPYFAGTAIWNEFDFSQPNVGGTISHINHKGMATWDRIPKDVYYLYKANWNPEPIVYIATRDWMHRAGKTHALSVIDVYSNLERVSLTVNGRSFPAKSGNAVHKFTWKISLAEGLNTIVASGTNKGDRVTDQAVVEYRIFDDNLKTPGFARLAINTGSGSQYTDDSDMTWIEDRPYTAGSFGYTGGTPSMLNIKTLITHTEDTPLFYSYLDGISGYRLDVNPGRYEVELCFAEPEKLNAGERVFSISINDSVVEPALDLTSLAGLGTAVQKKYIVDCKDAIRIAFNASAGKAILNGLKITKL